MSETKCHSDHAIGCCWLVPNSWLPLYCIRISSRLCQKVFRVYQDLFLIVWQTRLICTWEYPRDLIGVMSNKLALFESHMNLNLSEYFWMNLNLSESRRQCRILGRWDRSTVGAGAVSDQVRGITVDLCPRRHSHILQIASNGVYEAFLLFLCMPDLYKLSRSQKWESESNYRSVVFHLSSWTEIW